MSGGGYNTTALKKGDWYLMKKSEIKRRQHLYRQKKALLMAASTITIVSTAITSTTETEKEIVNSEATLLPTNAGASKAIFEDITPDNIEPLIGMDEVINSLAYNDEHYAISGNIVNYEYEGELRTYYDFPCAIELQDHIYDMSEKYGVPHKVMMTIIDRESGGQWNTNGVISYTNDYGIAQINKCNEEEIMAVFGWTMEDILHDPYKCIEVEAYFLKGLMDRYDYTLENYDAENLFGSYNGWLNWRKKEMAVIYAEACMEIMEEKFEVVSRIYK